MRVIIAGSRHMPYESYDLINRAVEKSGFKITEVVSGHAEGADKLGELWARTNKIPCKVFPAEWDLYGRAAGPIRNGQMKDYADALIVFIWDGSRGSENMRKQMEKAKKPYYAVYNGVIN